MNVPHIRKIDNLWRIYPGRTANRYWGYGTTLRLAWINYKNYLWMREECIRCELKLNDKED